MVILVHTWLVEADTTISSHFLWAEMEIILFIHFIHLNMHMDGAWDTFWIKSQNGTFLGLQMKSFGPKKFWIPCMSKKVPFWQFYQKSANWLDWPALLVQPSISAHRKWQEMVVSASTNQVWTKITVRSYAHVFCHSESDRSSVLSFKIFRYNFEQFFCEITTW